MTGLDDARLPEAPLPARGPARVGPARAVARRGERLPAALPCPLRLRPSRRAGPQPPPSATGSCSRAGPQRPRHDPWLPGAFPRRGRSARRRARSPRSPRVFLTGRECPWRCVMCDLWQHTTETDTPAGAIPRQIELALEAIARTGTLPTRIKLYNAGSFFDPRAVPRGDYDGGGGSARQLRSRRRGVASGTRRRAGRPAARRARPASCRLLPEVCLEVAMGLETAHPEALARLHKGMTLEQFEKAALALRAPRRRTAGVPARAPAVRPAAEEGPWLSALDRLRVRVWRLRGVPRSDANRERSARGAQLARACFASRASRISSTPSGRPCPRRAAVSSPTCGISSVSPTAPGACRRDASSSSA